MLRVTLFCLSFVALSSGSFLVAAEPVDTPSPAAFPNESFAFDKGTGPSTLSSGEQAQMLKYPGYVGIGYAKTAGIPDMLAARDKRGLKMFSIYVGADRIAVLQRPRRPARQPRTVHRGLEGDV